MTIVTRLRLLTAVLGAAAATVVVGTTVFGDGRAGRASRPDAPAVRAAVASADELGRTKFSTLPAVTYKAKGGTTTFAWQVKPTVAAGPARDRDIVVVVDTSASQAGAPLQRARQIIDGLAANAGKNDRIDVWTANLNDEKATQSLTRGLKPASDAEVTSAAARLVEVEFAAGATDLKTAVERVAAAIAVDPNRQQVILYLGDGESAASTEPLTEAVRTQLGRALEAKQVQFFAVPLGVKLNAHNLHGFASLTGGTVVRLTDDTTTDKGRRAVAAKLGEAFAVPVLRPTAVTFGAEVAEAFPSKLPPLRADRPTLVVGTLKADAAAVTAKVTGTVGGQPTTVELAEALPAADKDHFFLHAMLEQWKTAGDATAPAILAADRALALASQQFGLFREEYLTQAVYAVSSDKYDHAAKLYEAARKIDPTNTEAVAGLDVVARMKNGTLTRQQVRAELTADAEKARKALGHLSRQDPATQPPAGGAKPAEGGQAAPAAPAAPPVAALQQAQAERAVQEQQYRVLVDEAIRRARAGYKADPDAAYEDLKRQRDLVATNAALSDAFRGRLVADLEQMMQTIAFQGAAIKRNLAEERTRIANTRLRINEYERKQSEEQQTKAQIDAFKQLMNQARFELAQQEAQIMIQERISRGQEMLPETVAAYMIGQAATNLREHRELVRIREDRFLLALLQSEKSFIPYPDEPPVHFPPAAVWRQLTRDRAKYGSAALGSDVNDSQRRIQSILEGPDAQRLKLDQELDGLELKDFLANLEKDHNLSFFVLEDEFKAEGEAGILSKKMAIKQKLTGLTLGAALDIALPSVGATYVVRPQYIEITTFNKRLKEKVVRAFDVTELVYQIPQSVNQAVLFQNQQVQGQNLALFGQASFAGGFGAIGGLGLGGGFGALGGALGGGLGGALGGGALGGGGMGGIQGGFGGGFGGGAANNLGFGGGVAGVGGGQLGQFGNLGGQFGIQGNDLINYQLIATLITEVVARGEWADLAGIFQVGTQGQPGQGGVVEPPPKLLPEDQLNSLAYYPPTRALIVRGTGKYHPQSSVKLKKVEGAMGNEGNPARKNDRVAKADGGDDGVRAAAIADLARQRKGIDTKDATRMWQQAMDVSKVTDPGFVVACADFLFERDEPGHAAELLKAGVRRGLTSEVWAHDALAIAMRRSGAAAGDIARVSASAMDLEPANADGYLKAAKVAADYGQTDTAVAYCKRAADINPNQPTAYANALAYAEKAGSVKTDAIAWATDNLLRRDWTADTVDYHAETSARLARIVDKFEKAGQPAQVERFKTLLATDLQRDLVVELLWQGTADLDLSVTEPTGSTASPTHKRTAGGGVLRSDVLEQANDRSEQYAAAQAFSGAYTVKVSAALGKAIGNRAQVRVTKFKGTDREAIELFTVNLANPQPVTFTLDGGSRAELIDTALETVPVAISPDVKAATDMVNGMLNNPYQRSAARTGAVGRQPQETRLAGVAPAAPALRAVMDVTPDGKNVRISANPVFGKADDVPVPAVSLLPGGGR